MQFPILEILVSFSAFFFSIYAELFMGAFPCKLCLYQRFLFLMVGLSFMPLMALKKQNLTLTFLPIALVFLGAFLSIYHIAIQQGFLVDSCRVTSDTSSIKNFTLYLQNETTKCSKSTLNIFQIPASWYSLGVYLFFLVRLLLKKEKSCDGFTTGRF